MSRAQPRPCCARASATRNRTGRSRFGTSSRGCIRARQPDHVQVTNGGAEANYVTTWHLVEPGDEVVMMTPNYMQTRGLSRAFGATVKDWPLRLDRRRQALACGCGRARAARDSAHETDHHLQPEQPYRRAFRGSRSRSHCIHRRSTRELDSLGRDLSRRRARRPRHAVDVGTHRPSRRHERAVQGVRASGPAHRLGRGSADARGHVVVVPRLHDDFAGSSERRARPPRARARAARTHPRENSTHPQRELSGDRAVARFAWRAVQLRCRRTRARSSTSAITTG